MFLQNWQVSFSGFFCIFGSYIINMHCKAFKQVLPLIFLLLSQLCAAQEDAWVYFTDKPDSAYYLANPLQMLSQRALDRRTAQAIPLDEYDIPVHQAYIDGIAAVEGITVMARSKWLNALHIRGSVNNINALTSLSYVASVQFANHSLNTGRGIPHQPPRAPAKAAQAMANYNYGTSSTQVTMLNGQLLHQQDYTGTGKIIALMDNGFPGVNTTQPFYRLNNNGQILGGYNYVSGTDNIYTGGSHGTTVLSAMGGYTEGQLVGTAPDAQYYLFVTEDTAGENPVEESYWVEAAEAADSLGADVINTSLGYFIYDNPAYSYSNADLDGQTAFISRGANIAAAKGIAVVVAAGNSGASSTPFISVPADAPGVFTIGAVNASEVRATFSSTGPTADGRIKPDVMALGVSAVSATPTGTITTVNGTSLSSPIICGLVACLWQALPQLTNVQLLQLIRESADRFSNPDNLYGYGIPDFAQALLSLAPINDGTGVNVLYPNPSNGMIRVSLKDNSNARLYLFNTLGQLVLQCPAYHQQAIDITALPTGMYTYRLEGTASVGGQLIKQ